MARYFLNLHECGSVAEDIEGQEFGDLADARLHAIEAARDVMSTDVLAGRLCMACHIQIMDAHHHPVMEVEFRDALEISGL